MKKSYLVAIGLMATLSVGCGLFGELPDYQGADAATGPDSSSGEDAADGGVDADEDVADDVFTGECRQDSDCDSFPNAVAQCDDNTCVYDCEQGFADRDDDLESNGCECAISDEVCDGTDNDCDGLVDNIFRGGQISAGGQHTCAIGDGGDVYCWGDNAAGQLGLGDDQRRRRPTFVDNDLAFEATSVAAGGEHTCIVDQTNDGIFCWGRNAHGQLGDGTADDQNVPTLANHGESPSVVRASAAHTCAIDANDAATCWGDNEHGQLGVGLTDPEVVEPTPVAGDLEFRQIDPGQNHTCGVTKTGEALCWGANDFEQLGLDPTNGAIESTREPEPVDISDAFVDTATNLHTSCARQTSDEVTCWGAGDHAPRLLVDEDETPLPFVSVSANSFTFCGLDADGNAHCQSPCHLNTENELICDHLDWTQTTGLNLVDISVGNDHVCALSAEGQAYCWGSNSRGQLGNGLAGGATADPVVAKCE
jgi:hypothetical protein